jgi:glutaredoxin 3
MSAPIVIYTTRTCGYCVAAKRFLSLVKNVPFREIDVSNDPDAREDLVQRSGQFTVPQIWIGDRHIGGYDDLRALDAEGGLDPLLDATAA